MNEKLHDHPELRLQEYDFTKPEHPDSEYSWLATRTVTVRRAEITQPDFADPAKETLQ